jgi:hypothetical protein
VDSTRAAARQAIADLAEATAQLRRHLESNERLHIRALESLDAGMTIQETMASIPSFGERKAAEDSMQRLYSVRHQVREAVVTAAVEEGMSVPQIAAAYGLPVDRAAAYVSALTDRREA